MSRYSFEDFRGIMDTLRGENGCPWDREQTHESLRSTTLEEAYEVVEAINQQDKENLKEELGDLLLHVVFHSKIAEDSKSFTIDDVIQAISEKMIRRHPHVFGEQKVESASEVLVNWDEIKKQEKTYKNTTHQLEAVPKALPALTRAYKVQSKAGKVGFDFPDAKEAFRKVEEELHELKKAVHEENSKDIEEEYGDLLFSMVNISRFFEINPEISLTNAVEKFINRFKGIEEMASNKGLIFHKLSIHEMDVLWNEIKKGTGTIEKT